MTDRTNKCVLPESEINPGFKEHHPLSFGSRGFDVSRGPPFVPSGINHHLFENLRRKGLTATA